MASTDINLKKVLGKLYSLHLDAADFVMTRWLFDWDSDKPTMENIDLAHKEKDMLIRLKNQGCIDFRTEDNPVSFLNQSMQESPTYSDYEMVDRTNLLKGFKKFHSCSDYAISDIKFNAPESDKAWAHYDWAVWITGFNFQKFDSLCKSIGFDPSINGSPAELSFTSISTPAITLDGIVYTLNPLSEGGKPFNIVNYCLNSPGKLVRLDELRRQPGLATVTNINQALKRSCFDHNNGLLRYFINSSAGSITVKSSILLSSQAKQKLIQIARQS